MAEGNICVWDWVNVRRLEEDRNVLYAPDIKWMAK
jgi:hypothetical protein